MLTKLAGIVLLGSLGALAVSGVTGLGRHHSWDRFERKHVVKHAAPRAQRAERVRAERRTGAEGTYVFNVDTNVLGKFPVSAHVELDLKPSGRYELRVRTHVDGETESETSWGRYRVTGDRVELYSPADEDTHELRLNGNRLEFTAGFKERLALKAVGIEDAAFTRR